ncbi:hypothetical protein H920_05458 [Fukomys damarensis]|uniref:Uncharacterized protein n=1 Tax=Fukomys damarensis TaxID=885580 RepID=A0A091DSP0_FUKDA|nr:hypothetical protein H920_05458 [Fukomys damarensis]
MHKPDTPPLAHLAQLLGSVAAAHECLLELTEEKREKVESGLWPGAVAQLDHGPPRSPYAAPAPRGAVEQGLEGSRVLAECCS